MKRKIHETLLELWIGEFLFGLICQLGGMLFLSELAFYSIGLWIGVLTSMVSAYHMWYSLDLAMDQDEKTASKIMGSRYLVRYMMFVLVLGVTYYAKIGNPFATFLGYMGLKVAAYMQPFVHKIISGKHKKHE